MRCPWVTLVCVVIATATATTATTNTCRLDHPEYNCATYQHIQMKFSKVTIEGCGEQYKKELLSSIASVTFHQADQSAIYTLVMTDPDAPGSAEGQAWLHWIHSGLKGSDLAAGKLTGTDVISYARPTPPPRTGIHRYALFVFREGEGPKKQEVVGSIKRARFEIFNYAQKHGLCGPLAMNMFLTAYD